MVGEGSVVRANIKVESAVIGDTVYGDVDASRLIVTDGALFKKAS